jgi:esterase/lipase
MSLRSFLDTDNHFNVENIEATVLNIGGFIHEKIGDKYVIRSGTNAPLLAFDTDDNLFESSTKSYCDAISNNVTQLNATQISLVAGVQRHLTQLNLDIQNAPTDANFETLQADVSTLQGQVTTLTTYMNNMKRFINVIQQALNIVDPETDEQYDFTNLL